MRRTKNKNGPRILRSWKSAQTLLERWRRAAATLQVQLKRPRVIDAVPIDFLRGEPVEQIGEPTLKFKGCLIYFTRDDVTIRRPSGAILVIDLYEIAALSDGKTRLEPPA